MKQLQINNRTTITISKEDREKFRRYMEKNQILKANDAFSQMMDDYWKKQQKAK